jgi:Fic family protein
MKTFSDLDLLIGAQPPRMGVLLSRIDIGKGREGLYRDQLPELLRALADQARFESIRASTALEGIDVEEQRARRIAQPDARVRNRNEREFAGYRDAIDELTRAAEPERLSVPFILHLHRRLYEHSGGRGGYLKTDDNLIARRDEQGRRTIVFEPPSWRETEFLLRELVDRYNDAWDNDAGHPLVLLGAFVLDFLAIHPVADGNGRLARLLTTHELLRNSYGIARYVSVEQRIWETKHSYYSALEQSQRGWHEASHDVWPWIEYLASVLSHSYDVFEGRVAAAQSAAGLSKQEIVRRHVLAMAPGRDFRLRDLRLVLPGISDPTFGIVLRQLKLEGEVRVNGTGHAARWTRT